VLLLGVTGGIGMGKSTSARFLARFGLPVADTDQIARDVVQPGQPALAEIRREFGEAVFAADGSLDRARLADRVFADPEARRVLESILHPRIRAEWERRAREWKERGEPAGVVVIPLLFETNAETKFDAVICVACSAEAQRLRLSERGWPPAQIEGRIAAQWPVAAKIEKSTFVIWTDPPESIHERQLARVLRTLGITPRK
jgi:dephospho-CoA kinase